jgi:hypothetical protein
MKTLSSAFSLGLLAAVAFSGVSILPLAANAQNCPAYDSSVVSRVRQRNVPVGNILINNNYGPDPQSGAVTIRLYHSDAPDRIFSTWNFAGGESANLAMQDNRINIGGDWGIQIVFGNGVTSCISPVADVGRFENGRYIVAATDIYRSNTSSSTSTSSSSANLLAPETSPQVTAQNYVDMGGGWGGARATLNRDGYLVIEGQAVSNANNTATRTSVFVVGIDRRGRTLFVSNKYDIRTACGRWDPTCPSERADTFTESIAPELAQYVAQLNVYAGEHGSTGFQASLDRINQNVRAACASYDDLPVAARAAIAYKTGFAGCNPGQ